MEMANMATEKIPTAGTGSLGACEWLDHGATRLAYIDRGAGRSLWSPCRACPVVMARAANHTRGREGR
jgi:hypothetical protein